jgi:Na+-driven multidrug efflux pump
VAPLLAVSGALLFTQVTNSLVYSCTTKSAALAGTTSAAAHQIILQIWWLLSYFPVPLYLAAQSLLGRDLGRGDIPRAQATIRLLVTLGVGLALALGVANAKLPAAFPGAFTKDAAVTAAVAAVVPAACVAQAAATINTSLEGVFAGAGRLRYVASVSLLSSSVGIASMAALSRQGAGLGGAWLGLCVFEAVRMACHAISWRAFAADVREGRARGAVPPAEKKD